MSVNRDSLLACCVCLVWVAQSLLASAAASEPLSPYILLATCSDSALILEGETCADTGGRVLLALDQACTARCESRHDACVKDADTRSLQEKCKTYRKACLRTCQ